MRRRDWLSTLATGSVLAIAGCLHGGGDEESDGGNEADGDDGDADTDGDSGSDGDADTGGDGGDGDAQPSPPSVSWQFGVADDGGSVEITHAAGGSVNGDQLRVTGEGLASEGYWHELSDSIGPDDAVMAGETITVGVEGDWSLELVWETPDGSETTVIGTTSSP